MAWYWNEFVYIGIWILMIFFGLGAAVYAILTSDDEEGFVDQSFDVQSFLAPYKIKEVCEVFQPVLEAEINAERANGTSQRPDSEARERATKNLQKIIPGGPLQCPLELSTSDDLREQHDQFQKLPDTLLITIYATLLYSLVNLQMTYNKIVKTMVEANKAKAEAFQDICTPEQAEEKRKTQCKLPEELTPEEKQKIEDTYKINIVKKKTSMIQALGKWMKDYLSEVISTRNAKAKELQEAIVAREVIRKKNKDAGEDISDEDQRKQETAEEQATILEEIVARLNYTEAFMKYSIDDMIKQSKSLIGKIDVLKKKLEAGDTTLPQESFMDYFVSPLH
jgi:hypothetical protein